MLIDLLKDRRRKEDSQDLTKTIKSFSIFRYKLGRSSMFAVLKSGGKEYRVAKGDVIRVEKIGGSVGDQVTLKDVLMVSGNGETHVGTPNVKNAVIIGEIVQEAKGKKVFTYKMKRRKNYRRMKGHRQTYTYLKVNEIALS